jgi:hypothetical protein
MKNLLVFLILFAATCADAQIATGGNYTLDQSVVASGGVTSAAGGTFKVEGTAGQAGAGTKQIHSPYNFYSGFWTAQTIFTPTAASVAVGGRVLTANGVGIRNVRVTITSASGVTRTAISSSFGYFQFEDVVVGETYIFNVFSKRFIFSEPAQVHSIFEEIDDIVFTANGEI